MPKRTSSYRARLLQSLTNPIEAMHYINAALDDSPEMFLKALRNVAQAQNRDMADIAREAGIARESLYRALSSGGNPRLDTLHSVLTALGFGIHIGVKELSEKAKGKQREAPAITFSEPRRDMKAAHILLAGVSQVRTAINAIVGNSGVGYASVALASRAPANINRVAGITAGQWQQSGGGIIIGFAKNAKPEPEGQTDISSFVPRDLLASQEEDKRFIKYARA